MAYEIRESLKHEKYRAIVQFLIPECVKKRNMMQYLCLTCKIIIKSTVIAKIYINNPN